MENWMLKNYILNEKMSKQFVRYDVPFYGYIDIYKHNENFENTYNIYLSIYAFM